MAETAAATPSAPGASTPAAGGSGQGPSDTPQNQSQSQNQNQNSNAGSSTAMAATTNNNENQNPDQRANRGLPYYEKLRRELRDTLQKKRLMDKSMAQLEDQIFRFEQSYLEETTAGNIIKGFDNYIKGSSTGSGLGAGGISLSTGAGTASRRKSAVTDNDRVFSRSSASFMRDSPTPSTQTTPSHAPTPNSTYNGSTGKPGNGDTSSTAGSVKGSSSSSSKNKKKAANKGEEDEEDKPPTKRFKITYAGRE
ncbi:histone acetyltransferase subunit NuA4-domain-containing protein [Aspergillus tetrazonus]